MTTTKENNKSRPARVPNSDRQKPSDGRNKLSMEIPPERPSKKKP